MKVIDKRLATWLAATLLFGLAMIVIHQSTAANIAFFVAGGLLTTITQLIAESRKRDEVERDLARSLYEELVNRVARCLFDFENPWERWIDERNCARHEVDVLRLRKFMPVAPTIYPATAGQIALLGDAAQAVIRFYASFAILRSDMESVARSCERNAFPYVPPGDVAVLAERLRRTLKPGLEALRRLSPYVEGHEKVEAEAIRDADALFRHERADLALRQRLEHYVKNES